MMAPCEVRACCETSCAKYGLESLATPCDYRPVHKKDSIHSSQQPVPLSSQHRWPLLQQVFAQQVWQVEGCGQMEGRAMTYKSRALAFLEIQLLKCQVAMQLQPSCLRHPHQA